MFRLQFKKVTNKFAPLYKRSLSDTKTNAKKLNEIYLGLLNKKIIKYDNYRMDSYPHIPVLRLGATLVGLSVMAGGTYWWFKPHIHRYITNDASTIAGKVVESKEVQDSIKTTLNNPEVFADAQQLIKKLAITTCNDQEITNSLNVLVLQLLNKPETKDSINSLLVQVLGDPAVQNALVDSAVNFINRQEIQDQLSALIIAILDRQDVKNKANTLVDETCGNDLNREHLKNMVNAIFTSHETKDALYDLVASLFSTSIFGKKKTS